MKKISKFLIIFVSLILLFASLNIANAQTKKYDETEMNVNFGSFMRKLQTKIKSNWTPPKSKASNRVVLFFKVNKKGKAFGYKILESSGDIELDKSAIEAVKKSSPFDSFPMEFPEKSVDIQFTFDYNVYGKDGKKTK